jgi:hypothetical protein
MQDELSCSENKVTKDTQIYKVVTESILPFLNTVVLPADTY